MNRRLRWHLLIFAGVAGLLLLMQVCSITCPIRAVSGIPCPACGMTRSFLALLQLDWKESLYYNPCTIPFVLAFLVAVHRDKIPCKNKLALDLLVVTTAVFVFLVYLFRIFTNTIP